MQPAISTILIQPRSQQWQQELLNAFKFSCSYTSDQGQSSFHGNALSLSNGLFNIIPKLAQFVFMSFLSIQLFLKSKSVTVVQSGCRCLYKEHHDSTKSGKARLSKATGYSAKYHSNPQEKWVRGLHICFCFTNKHLIYLFAFLDLFYIYGLEIFINEKLSITHSEVQYFTTFIRL